METHGCVFGIVTIDAPVLKHQAISLHCADQVYIALDQLHTDILYWQQTPETEIRFGKNDPVVQGVMKTGKFVPHVYCIWFYGALYMKYQYWYETNHYLNKF